LKSGTQSILKAASTVESLERGEFYVISGSLKDQTEYYPEGTWVKVSGGVETPQN